MTWQELIDDVYKFWNSGSYSYKEALEYAQSTYGDLGELAILLKNYNYQVENGGHFQYFDNGYCDFGEGCLGERDTDLPLHKRMIELFEKFGLHETEYGKPVYEVMTKFSVEIEPESEEEIEVECSYCYGSGVTDDGESCPECEDGYTWDYEVIEEYIYIHKQEELDTDYFKNNDEYLDFFNGFVCAKTKEK